MKKIDFDILKTFILVFLAVLLFLSPYVIIFIVGSCLESKITMGIGGLTTILGLFLGLTPSKEWK